MVYTQAQIDAMNRQGAALLNSQKSGTYKPPTPTNANILTTTGTTLGRSGSRASDYGAYSNTPAPSYVPGSLGNQKINSYGSSSSSWNPRETVEGEKPSWLGGDPAGGDGSDTTSTDLTGTYAELSDAQLRAQTAALQKQLSNSLSNLDTQQQGLGSIYYDKRNQAAAASDIGAMNFAQRAAARGMAGNAAAMPDIYRENALQGQLGMLNRNEAEANAEIESARTNLRNNYESDLVAAQAGIQTQRLQNYIDQLNADRSFGLQEAGVTGTYNGQQTLAGQQQQLAIQRARLDLEAQAIQNSYLPDTYKREALLLQQQVEAGRIDINTALAKLSQIKNYSSSATPTNQIATSTAYYQDADRRLNSLTIPSSQTALIKQLNVEGKLSDAEATTLLQKYGLI